MNYKISLLLPCLLLSLIACDLNGSPDEQKRDKTAATQHRQDTISLQYASVSLQRANHPNCLTDQQNTPTSCATIAVHYPRIKSGIDKAISEQINSQIYAHVSHALSDYVETEQNQKRSKPLRIEDKLNAYLREFEMMIKEQPEMPGWERQLTGKVVYEQNGILALAFDQYGYEGGAHPNSLVSFLNFDLKTSVKLTLDDLFVANYQQELTQIAENYFRQARNVPTGDALDQAGFWFEKNRFALNDNFSIQAEGLVFLFNAYEIAPYVMGPTEFIVPWKSITQLINPQGPLSWAK